MTSTHYFTSTGLIKSLLLILTKLMKQTNRSMNLHDTLYDRSETMQIPQAIQMCMLVIPI